MGRDLPHPVTTTDEWLAAVHRELVGLRADLAATRPAPTPAPAGGGVRLLEEPAAPAPARRKAGSKTRTPTGS